MRRSVVASREQTPVRGSRLLSQPRYSQKLPTINKIEKPAPKNKSSIGDFKPNMNLFGKRRARKTLEDTVLKVYLETSHAYNGKEDLSKSEILSTDESLTASSSPAKGQDRFNWVTPASGKSIVNKDDRTKLLDWML